MSFVRPQRAAAPWSYGHWWGQYTDALSLPNMAGAEIQLSDVQKGDIAWAEAQGALFYCIDATIGAASWQQIEGGDIFPEPPQFVIDQVTGAGSGDTVFDFAMGCEIRSNAALAGGSITALSGKVGAGGVGISHSWILRQSTVSGPAAPPVGSYTIVHDSGVHTFAAADAWESFVAGGLPVPVTAANEWYTLMMWIGTGGQSDTIANLRSSGELNENLAELLGGLFVFQAGPPPGATPVPTTRSTTITYGMTSIEVTPP
jgi:hypothetical protein